MGSSLERNSCDSEQVYKFLKLLQQPEEMRNKPHFQKITLQEWMEVVKTSEKRSTSSIFSKWTYIVYKCALESSWLTNTLLGFYNIIIER